MEKFKNWYQINQILQKKSGNSLVWNQSLEHGTLKILPSFLFITARIYFNYASDFLQVNKEAILKKFWMSEKSIIDASTIN